MIKFEKQTDIFYLNTKNTTYAMGVNGGKLFHRYWGQRRVNPLAKTDLSDYLTRNFEAVDLEGSNSDIVPFEYSTYGNADMRIPSAEFTFADGSRVSNLYI